MKTMLPLRLALCGAVALFTQTTFAQTWQTIVDFRYNGHSTGLNSMGKDPFGNLYATGYGSETNLVSSSRALITKSSDGGATWSVSDSFALSPQPYRPEYRAITSDSVGNLYALADETYPDSHWIVRRSQDSGVTWSTVLDLTTVLRAIATDAAGNVYVLGLAWSVLKSTDGGTTWAIMDAFNPGRTPISNGILCHPTLGIFVAGSGDLAITTTKGRKTTTTYQSYWYVRRSLDGGATWTTVDAYLIDANAQRGGGATRLAADTLGNLYVSGTIAATYSSVLSLSSDYHWIVRKSANGGTAWTTVDDYFPKIGGTNYSASPNALAADASGNLFVGGTIYPAAQIYIYQALAKHEWVVRKLPAGSSAWQTVDDFQYAPGRNSIAHDIVADDFGNVFVGGVGFDATGVNNGSSHWLVRTLVP